MDSVAPEAHGYPAVDAEATDAREAGTVRVGVDIGQVHDPTAIVVTQEVKRERAEHFMVRHIERLPLGTSYPEVAQRIADVVKNLHAMRSGRLETGAGWFTIEVLVDATGVGRPVIDLVKRHRIRAPLIAVTLTGGDALTEREGNRVSMAKSILVSRLQVLLQTGHLQLPATPDGALLASELADYRIDVSAAGNATFAARIGQHDDLVIALGLSTGTGKPAQLQFGAAAFHVEVIRSGRFG